MLYEKLKATCTCCNLTDTASLSGEILNVTGYLKEQKKRKETKLLIA